MQQGLEQRRARPGGPRRLDLLVPALAAVFALLSQPATAQPVDVTVGDLPSGGSITIEIVVTAPAPAPAGIDAFSTQGTVGGGNFPDLQTDDPDAGGTDDPTITLLAALPDLTLDKSYAGPTPLPGDTVAFDLAFSNDGNQGATGVTITDTVPLHSTFNAGASSGVWSCLDGSPAGTVCNLAFGALAGGGAGASAVFAVDLVNPLPPGASELSNTASIADDAANGADPNPGDNSDTVVVGLDAVAPTVDQVDTVPATADGELTDCETVTAPINGFELTFSEELQDPPGDTDPNDVTNPDNYLLVTAGPNATYETFACGGAGGDDVAVPIAAVAYDAVGDVAGLDLGGALGGGLHRLFVCDTLRDVAGNPLDGFDRSFRADPGNLFANGHFDCDQAEWTGTASGGATIGHDPAVDVDGSPDSGSSQATLLSPGTDPAQAAVTQCVPVAGGQVALEGRARLAADPGEVVAITLRCDLFAVGDCAGGLAGTGSATTVLGDTAGAFVGLDAEIAAGGAVSARCGIHWDAAAGVAFDGWLDALTAEGPIFADGFESGDTSAWSETVP
jgi:uncharacterized repeat protein (TIGR01451 family)